MKDAKRGAGEAPGVTNAISIKCQLKTRFASHQSGPLFRTQSTVCGHQTEARNEEKSENEAEEGCSAGEKRT